MTNKMFKLKPVQNKWQVVFTITPPVHYFAPHERELTFGILRIHTLPGNGYHIGKEHYNGFLVRLSFLLPVVRRR